MFGVFRLNAFSKGVQRTAFGRKELCSDFYISIMSASASAAISPLNYTICSLLTNTNFHRVLCYFVLLLLLFLLPAANASKENENRATQQQHRRCEKPSVVSASSFIHDAADFSYFAFLCISFFFLNFMKCHYFWSKFSILFFTECFTFYYGHSFFSLTLSTMINKINLFKLYLHSYCTCDAIMTSKVKLDITTTIFFISCARFCFHSKGVVVCFIFSIYFVVGCFIFLVILSFIHHFSRCYCVRFAVLCSHGTVSSTGKWRRIKYNQMNRSK